MIRSGQICVSLLYNYLTSNVQETDSSDSLDKKSNTLKIISNTFSNYGGVLSKLAQMLNHDNPDNNSFSDCKPFSQKETSLYLENLYNTDVDFSNQIKSIDFKPFKSGSVGQIHKTVLTNGDKIIIKVQYVGLEKQIKADLAIIDMFVKYMYNFINPDNAMKDIKRKLFEELDYENEMNNQKRIYELWDGNNCYNIKIPKIYDTLCSGTTIGMELIDGNGLGGFIETATQQEKNDIGLAIFYFIFKNIFVHKIYYSDLHYGNFLVNNGALYVTDFGCLHDLSDQLVSQFKSIYKCISNEDKDRFYVLMTEMGILNDEVSPASKEYMYEYFVKVFEPLTHNDFEFTHEWSDDANKKEPELMKEWNLPENLVHFNKIVHCLYFMFVKLNLKGNFRQIFEDELLI